MTWVAYYGQPSLRVWGRCQWLSKDAAMMDCWNNSNLYGLHDADAERTHLDRLWAEMGHDERKPEKQMRLFEEAD